MNSDQLREAIAFGREQQAVEFKSAGPSSDRQLLAKDVRAMLALANHPDGGVVVVGVTDDLVVDGLSDDDLKTWDRDDLGARVQKYADPFPSFVESVVELDGAKVVVIRVEPFRDYPVICTRQMGQVLIPGAIYIRGQERIESRAVQTAHEMHDLVSRSAMFQAKRLLAQYQELRSVDARSDITGVRVLQKNEVGVPSEKLNMWSVAESRGHWSLRVRPHVHDVNRLGRLATVEDAVRRCRVSMRGWDFPYIPRGGVSRGGHIVYVDSQWQHHIDCWIASRSGQFLGVHDIQGEWRDKSELWPHTPDWKPGRLLHAVDAAVTLWEMCEFVSRWSDVTGCQDFTATFGAHGLNGRELMLSERRAPLWPARVCQEEAWVAERGWADLVDARDASIQMTQELFELFGWDITVAMGREIQDDLNR